MKILVDAEKCTGCKTCELACCFIRAQVFNPRRARIKVIDFAYIGCSYPVTCIQCTKPKCIEVCPKGALSKTDTGTIHVDQEQCSGCRLCVDECIIGAIHFDNEKGLPLICDLCSGSPACVEWCPSGALTVISGADRREKALSYAITKVKPSMNKRSIPEDALEWYRKFNTPEMSLPETEKSPQKYSSIESEG